MFKVYIDAITIDMKCSDVHDIEIHNENDLYQCRHMIKAINRQDGPFLVRLIAENTEGYTRLIRSHICYNGDGIYNFIKREIERIAIHYGMHEIFDD